MMFGAFLAAALGQALQLPLDPGSLWSRSPGTIQARSHPSGGLELVHTGKEDWSLSLGGRRPARPGQAFRLSAQLSAAGGNGASLSFVARRGDEVADWLAGPSQTVQSGPMRRFESVFVAGPGVTTVEPRLVGSGPGSTVIQSPMLEPLGILELAPEGKTTASSAFLELTVSVPGLSLRFKDRKTGRTWETRPVEGLLPRSVEARGRTLAVKAWNAATLEPVTAAFTLSDAAAEASMSLSGSGRLRELAFPGAFVAHRGESHILPVNMGMEIPAEGFKAEPLWLIGYGGHGLSMAFYALSGPKDTALTLIQDPDDFILAGGWQGTVMEYRPVWQGEKGQFAYPRRLTWSFLKEPGHVAVCRRVREFSRARGLIKTLAEKAKANPNVARIARAANFWSWDGRRLDLAREAEEAGMKHMLWSGGGTPEQLRELRKLGYIVGRYDIYQDVMDPAMFSKLAWTHPDWTTEAWPKDLVRTESGDWEKGWVVQDKEGHDVPCGVLCDRQALAYAKRRIPDELKTHPYEARFIDTTTASPWRECWDPNHPMTRRESRRFRMDLLQYVTSLGLVTGSETGEEASVPYLAYYEGMMSLGPYRVPDAGTLPPKVYDVLPERVLTYQLGRQYRLPLWQLVYGDCTVSQWYWGDASNKNLATWRIRDLWNCLYGSPALYFTDLEFFRAHKDEFARSWKTVDQAVEATAMARMTDHRFLTPDREVQESVWSNGTRVFVNFSTEERRSSGLAIPPLGVIVKKG